MKMFFTLFVNQKWGFSQIRNVLIFAAILGCFVTSSRVSAQMFVYPAKGQSADQLNRDKL